MYLYAEIFLLDNPYPIDRAYDYYIPGELTDTVGVGDFVMVPFGASNRRRMGLVSALKEQPDGRLRQCKPILSVCDRTMSLSEEMLSLCFFMKEQTLCTVGDAVRAMVPASALSYLEEIYRYISPLPPSDLKLGDLSEGARLLCETVHRGGSVRFDTVKTRFGAEAAGLLKELVDKEILVRDFTWKQTGSKTKTVYVLAISPERADAIYNGTDSEIKLRSGAHLTILRTLAEQSGEMDEHHLTEQCGVTSAQITALCKKGLIERRKLVIDRSLPDPRTPDPRPIVLNEEQQAAYETLCTLSDSQEAKAALLFGVTGSGKTSVMLKTIDRVLERGKGVIVLLPEIALTPQTLEIFCSRYGDRVAVIHSGLSAGERLDTHKRIRSGGADVVIGTRSAVFAPLCDVGLIVLDEEQEHTYKSDMNPKYHARDIARFRCAHHKALMLLASATPSFDSFYKAKKGVYTLIKLTRRYGNAVLPKVTIADLRGKTASSATSPLGDLLCQKLYDNQKRKEQAILFLNRRGYNHFVSCRSCGEAILCPHCSVSMTYHTTRGYDEGELRCHWCGTRMPLPKTCPSCGSEHLSRMGFGTQRAEQELQALLPDARILRMDTDTTTSRYSYEEMLTTFRRHEADVLLGTQMVTKGHDFPDVTLVGVLSADAALYLEDYRAAERTFAMLTQVIGRAGRGDKPGEAIIQTSNPDHECIRLACAQDYERFYEAEIRLRRTLTFPPFCDIALLTLSGTRETELMQASTLLTALLDELLGGDFSDVPTVRFGPFEAPVYKVENRYRMRMILKCRLNKRSRTLFSELLLRFSRSTAREILFSVDFNPSNL